MKKRIVNPDMVVEDLIDPTGFTPENNPHPNPYSIYGNEQDDYMEWDEYGMPIMCHVCLLRSKYGSGNCVDGGKYYEPCLEKKLEYMRNKDKKKSVQSKLL